MTAWSRVGGLRTIGGASALTVAALAVASAVGVQSVSAATASKATASKAALVKATTAKVATAKVAAVKKTVRSPFPVITDAYATTLKSVAADLDEFWSTEMPRVYKKAFVPLSGYYAYTEASLPPSCGGRRPTRYTDIADNAFYCRVSDYIAFDNQGLFPEIYANFGEVGLATVIAHEMGHAIQARTSTRLASVYAELQADCFSGAWLARVTADKSPLVKLQAGSLDEAVQAILAFRDSPGIGAGTPGAHGNGFDRVNAFQSGFEEGTSRCAGFTTKQPIVTARDFTTIREADSGGNVPIETAVQIAVQTANAQFAANVPGFPNLLRVQPADAAQLATLKACPNSVSVADNLVIVCTVDSDGLPTVGYDAVRLERLYNATGDFGVSFGLVLGWAAVAQQKLGLATSSTSKAAELQAECFSGSWAGVLNAQTTGDTALSPGDLDEALTTLVRLPGQAGAFERVRAVRTGFLNGFAACKSI